MKQPTISRIILSLMSLCFFCNVLFAQNMVKVTGTVTDKQNSPMIGASVFEKGTRSQISHTAATLSLPPEWP